MKRSLYAAATAATVGAILAPASAQAQTPGTLVPLTPCIRFVDASLKTFGLQGAGFAPNAAVTIASDGAPIDTVTTDAAGELSQAVNAPPIAGNRANVSITADDGQGHPAGPVGLPEVKLGVVWPSNASARKRVLFRAYGFDPGKTVYLHIRRGGKTRGTFKIGRADSPCGADQAPPARDAAEPLLDRHLRVLVRRDEEVRPQQGDRLPRVDLPAPAAAAATSRRSPPRRAGHRCPPRRSSRTSVAACRSSCGAGNPCGVAVRAGEHGVRAADLAEARAA